MEADLVITNGKVITVDQDFSIREAVAVKNGMRANKTSFTSFFGIYITSRLT